MHLYNLDRRSGWLTGLGLLFLLGMQCSCTSTRQLTYMQGRFDTTLLSKIDYKEPVIRKGDILSILVFSDNPSATAIFNQQQTGGTGNPGQMSGGGSSSSGGSSGSSSGGGSSSTSSGSGGGTTGSGGYLVDENGNIEFQELGLIHVDGMMRSTLKDTLQTRLKDYLQNPYCTIRFMNYRFTMLGEVARPGIFNFPADHMNLFEALGMGGDLTFYGRRDNILVIRQTDTTRSFARLDLTKPEVMGSPYFYIQPNDVIYIEANKKKAIANDQTAIRTITISTAIISTLALLYTLFK